MQKQRKQLIGMLLVLVLLIAAYLGVRYYNGKQEEKESEQQAADQIKVTDFETGDITGFSYILDGETYFFTKDGEDWKWEGDMSLKLDASQIENMLSAAAGVTAEERITEYASLADYGLENPSDALTFTTADQTITLELGNRNEITSQYYLKRTDEDTVYLVGRDLSATFSKTPQELVAEEETEELE